MSKGGHGISASPGAHRADEGHVVVPDEPPELARGYPRLGRRPARRLFKEPQAKDEARQLRSRPGKVGWRCEGEEVVILGSCVDHSLLGACVFAIELLASVVAVRDVTTVAVTIVLFQPNAPNRKPIPVGHAPRTKRSRLNLTRFEAALHASEVADEAADDRTKHNSHSTGGGKECHPPHARLQTGRGEGVEAETNAEEG